MECSQEHWWTHWCTDECTGFYRYVFRTTQTTHVFLSSPLPRILITSIYVVFILWDRVNKCLFNISLVHQFLRHILLVNASSISNECVPLNHSCLQTLLLALPLHKALLCLDVLSKITIFPPHFSHQCILVFLLVFYVAKREYLRLGNLYHSRSVFMLLEAGRSKGKVPTWREGFYDTFCGEKNARDGLQHIDAEEDM